MKKLLAIMLCLVMLSSLTAGAFAEEELSYNTEPGGYRITVPDEVKNAVGMVMFLPSDTYDPSTEVYISCFYYMAMTPEEYAAMNEALADPKITEEEMTRLYKQSIDANIDLFTMAASATPELSDFYEKALQAKGRNPERIRLGEADGFVFDLYDGSPDDKEKIDALKSPFAEDYARVYAALKEALTKAELFAPDTSDPYEGIQLSFETKDLDGNPVKSEELFKENKITMLNIWATWCEPCKSELKELGEMDRRLQEKNCAIVGLLYDSAEEGAIEEGKALLKENGAEYLNLMFPEGLEEELAKSGKKMSYPTTLMVDGSGTVQGSFDSVAVELYEPMIERLLEDAQQAAEAEELVFDTEAAGFLFSLPAEFRDTLGTFSLYNSDELGGLYPDVYLTTFEYVAMPFDEMKAWNDMLEAGLADGSITYDDVDVMFEQEMDPISFSPLVVVTAADKDLEEAYYNQFALSEGRGPERILIAEKDGYVFYLYDYSAENEEKLNNIGPEFAEEYRRLEAAISDALSKAEFFAPPASKSRAYKGVKLAFETTDLDGNPVKSEEIFQQNEITMLNIWATWCGPCVDELDDLGELNGRLKDLNCGVVGLLYDAEDEGAVEKGKALLAENHADYLNLMPPKGFDDMVEITSFPTSLMVDRSGTVVASFLAKNLEAYEPMIRNLLAEK